MTLFERLFAGFWGFICYALIVPFIMLVLVMGTFVANGFMFPESADLNVIVGIILLGAFLGGMFGAIRNQFPNDDDPQY